jgi:hypothetical protein
VQVQSQPFPGGSPGCDNNTTVQVSEQGMTEFRKLLTLKPQSPYLSGNGMNLVDWSPDAHSLLVEVWRWNTQPTDAGVDKQIWLLDSRSGKNHAISLSEFLADQPTRKCGVEFDHLGFTPDGLVVARVHVLTVLGEGQTLNDIPTSRRCSESTQVWAFNWKTSGRTRLADNFVPDRYSRVIAPAQ